MGNFLPPPGLCFPAGKGRRISTFECVTEIRQPVGPAVVPGRTSRWCPQPLVGQEEKKGAWRGEEREVWKTKTPDRSPSSHLRDSYLPPGGKKGRKYHPCFYLRSSSDSECSSQEVTE